MQGQNPLIPRLLLPIRPKASQDTVRRAMVELFAIASGEIGLTECSESPLSLLSSTVSFEIGCFPFPDLCLFFESPPLSFVGLAFDASVAVFRSKPLILPPLSRIDWPEPE